jgi:hypothetical protein
MEQEHLSMGLFVQSLNALSSGSVQKGNRARTTCEQSFFN